jgi:hypothetical protein
VMGGFLAQTPDAVPLAAVTRRRHVHHRHAARADRSGVGRSALRLAGGQARALQRQRLRPRRCRRRRRRGADEPRR